MKTHLHSLRAETRLLNRLVNMAAMERPLGAMDLNSALAFLTQAHSTEGGSVYEHLTKVLAKASMNAHIRTLAKPCVASICPKTVVCD